jgi:hypothetical protein
MDLRSRRLVANKFENIEAEIVHDEMVWRNQTRDWHDVGRDLVITGIVVLLCRALEKLCALKPVTPPRTLRPMYVKPIPHSADWVVQRMAGVEEYER